MNIAIRVLVNIIKQHSPGTLKVHPGILAYLPTQTGTGSISSLYSVVDARDEVYYQPKAQILAVKVKGHPHKHYHYTKLVT